MNTKAMPQAGVTTPPQGAQGTPRTDALIARHRAETQRLYADPNSMLPMSDLREHATRQTAELIQHTYALESELSACRAALEPFASLFDPSWQQFAGTDPDRIEVGNFAHIRLAEPARSPSGAGAQVSKDGITEGVWETHNNASYTILPPRPLMVKDDLTVRDYFAAKAMQGFCANQSIGRHFERRAAAAYELADEMLKARAK